MNRAGLQIFDKDGKIILDTSDSLCRILGQFTADKEHGSFTPPNLEPTDRVFAYGSYSDRGYDGGVVPLTIYITNNQTINWRYRMDVAVNGMTEVITYGSY